MLSSLDSSCLGFKLFSKQYSSITSLFTSIRGLIYFPLIGSIPFSPAIPAPLTIFIIIVSALSFILCAMATLFAPTFSKTSS